MASRAAAVDQAMQLPGLVLKHYLFVYLVEPSGGRILTATGTRVHCQPVPMPSAGDGSVGLVQHEMLEQSVKACLAALLEVVVFGESAPRLY